MTVTGTALESSVKICVIPSLVPRMPFAAAISTDPYLVSVIDPPGADRSTPGDPQSARFARICSSPGSLQLDLDVHPGRQVQALELLHGLGGFFHNDAATTEIYTLSLHDALPTRRR